MSERSGGGIKKWVKGAVIAGALGTAGVAATEAGYRSSHREDVESKEKETLNLFDTNTKVRELYEKDSESGKFQKTVVENYLRFIEKNTRGDHAHVIVQRLYDGLISVRNGSNGKMIDYQLESVFKGIGFDDDIEAYFDTLQEEAIGSSEEFEEYVAKKEHPGMLTGHITQASREKYKKEFAKKEKVSTSTLMVGEANGGLAFRLLKEFITSRALGPEQTGAMLQVMHADLTKGQEGNWVRFDTAQRVEFDQNIRNPEFRKKVNEFSADDLTKYIELYAFKAVPKMHPELLLEEANLLLQDLSNLDFAVEMNKNKSSEHAALLHNLASKLDAVVNATTKFRLSAGDRAALTGMVNKSQETESAE